MLLRHGLSGLIKPPATGGEFFTTGATGPYFADPSNVPANTEAIRYKVKLRLPSAVTLGGNNTSYMISLQTSQGFDFRLINLSGTWNFQVEKIEDGTGAQMLLQSNLTTMSQDTWYEFDVLADMAVDDLVWSVNGGGNTTVNFTAASNGVFQSTRLIGFLTSAEPFPAGIEFEYWEVYFRPVSGSESLHKRIAGNAADPWKSGGDAT